jgi:hypothetical protein
MDIVALVHNMNAVQHLRFFGTMLILIGIDGEDNYLESYINMDSGDWQLEFMEIEIENTNSNGWCYASHEHVSWNTPDGREYDTETTLYRVSDIKEWRQK